MPPAACWALLEAGACSCANLEIPEPRPLLWDWVLCLTEAPNSLQYKGDRHWVALLPKSLLKKNSLGAKPLGLLLFLLTEVRNYSLFSLISIVLPGIFKGFK